MDPHEAVCTMIQSGVRVEEVARRTGYTVRHVYSIIQRNGIRSMYRAGRPRGPGHGTWNVPTVQQPSVLTRRHPPPDPNDAKQIQFFQKHMPK